MATGEVFGDLIVQVVKGVNLQNQAVFGTCNPYVLVKMRSSADVVTTAVRESDPNPSWMDTFTFRGVCSTDGLQISLMEKDGAREGVVSVGGFLASSEWGFPGLGGGERVLEVVMPKTSGSGIDARNMGTIVLKLRYRAELKFRAPFGLLKTAVAKTAILTDKAKIDVALDQTLNVIFKPVAVAGGVARRMTKAERIAYGGGAVAVSTAVGGGVSMGMMAVAIPAIFMAVIFLPLTLLAGFFFVTAMMLVLPFALGVGWIVFCSRPVQCRLWMPSLFWAVTKSSLVNRALLQTPEPNTGKEQ